MSAVLPEFRKAVPAEFRKPVMTLVEVSWEGPGGTLQTFPARMEDRSTNGACIRVKTPIAVGSKLRVQWRIEHFSGTVRYCRTDGWEYLVGIQRDTTESPTPNPSPTDLPPQKSASSSDPVVPTVRNQRPPKRQESKPNEVPLVEPKVEPKVEIAPIVPIASSTTTPARREIDNRDNLRSQLRDLDALLRVEPRAEPRTEPRTEPRIELQTKQPPKQAGKEGKHMGRKWLDLPWRKKQEGRGVSGPENGEADSDGNSNGKSEKEAFMPHPAQSTQKAPVRSAREVPSFQVDLSPMEDIYRAAGIMNPRRGYSINKVVEMLHSEHIRDLSKEMKRAAVLMALDTVGVPVEQVQKDAKARQDALDAHEAEQTKHVEAEWARKAKEIIQIQAELESIKAHYTSRIRLSMEGVAREKATFASWLTLKQQECQSMAEAVELCLKSPVSEPVRAPSSDVSMVKVSAKTV
jgi:hypothetical protein